VVVTVTTTFKSGGDKSPSSHTMLRLWVSWYRKGKTSLDLNEARDDGVLGCSGISWTTRKQSAPHCRQMTTPTPHHSIFTGRMLFLTPNQQFQSTEGKCPAVRINDKQK